MPTTNEAKHAAAETTRRIVQEVYEQHISELGRAQTPFEALWKGLEGQSGHDALGGEVICPLTEEELRRWARVQVLEINVAAMKRAMGLTAQRAQTMFRMLQLDIAERRGLEDDAPIAIDPVRGLVCKRNPVRAAAPAQPAGTAPRGP